MSVLECSLSNFPLSNYNLLCKDKLVIAIDTLRATSCIVTALANGAKYIIPASSIEDAKYIKASLTIPSLLCGEENCIKINGFDLGNSPFDFSIENVSGKVILMKTTNGTNLLNKSIGSNKVICGSILNINAIVKFVQNQNSNVLFSCAGTNGEVSLEDNITAGFIFKELLKSKNVVTYDSSLLNSVVSTSIAEVDIFSFISLSQHAQKLINLGFNEDVKFCTQNNLFDIVPFYSKGIIRL
jgi:2-phosphosulfolactate phosphatase